MYATPEFLLFTPPHLFAACARQLRRHGVSIDQAKACSGGVSFSSGLPVELSPQNNFDIVHVFTNRVQCLRPSPSPSPSRESDITMKNPPLILLHRIVKIYALIGRTREKHLPRGLNVNGVNLTHVYLTHTAQPNGPCSPLATPVVCLQNA